jgi:hypothetical protein
VLIGRAFIHEHITEIIKSIPKKALSFSPMFFDFDWFFLMTPLAHFMSPAESHAKQHE